MREHLRDHSQTMNLRAAFEVWPAGRPLPTTPDEAVTGAFDLVLNDVVVGRAATANLIRYADDGVSVWMVDAVVGMSFEDLIRGVACAFEPPAYAMVVVQPMHAPGDPTVRGVHCRAHVRDDLMEITGDVVGADGPVEGRTIPSWRVRRGTASSDAGRWIGVRPSVELELPLVAEGDA
jgi:hypothetical protein